MPLQYQGTVGEHRAVRGGVGVFDVSHLGRVWVQGPQAAPMLRSVTTFDVTTVPVGKAHYSLYCNESGGIEDDVFIYHLADDRWLVVHNASNAEPDFERVRAVAGDRATEVTADTVMLAVQGPEAMALLAGLLGEGIGDLGPRACAELDWRGAQVLFARTGYTGVDGGARIVGTAHAGALWDALVAGGATPCGLGARDTLRLEAALPLYGNDIDRTTHPYEAGLGFAVSLDDGVPFTGRAALADARSSSRTPSGSSAPRPTGSPATETSCSVAASPGAGVSCASTTPAKPEPSLPAPTWNPLRISRCTAIPACCSRALQTCPGRCCGWIWPGT